MPTLNETIADSIRAYPTLYNCRTDVLHQFFCVNGNGMDWENGELVDPYRRSEPPRSLNQRIEEIRKRVEENEFLRSLGNKPELSEFKQSYLVKLRVDAAREEMEIRFLYENADDLALTVWDTSPLSSRDWLKPKAIYPLCQYSCMNEVPDDVKPEWLAAVREMILAVFEAPASKPNHRQTAEQCAQEQSNNINFADNVLQSLNKRFGNEKNLPTAYQEFVSRKENARKETSRMLTNILKKVEKEDNELVQFKP